MRSFILFAFVSCLVWTGRSTPVPEPREIQLEAKLVVEMKRLDEEPDDQPNSEYFRAVFLLYVINRGMTEVRVPTTAEIRGGGYRDGVETLLLGTPFHLSRIEQTIILPESSIGIVNLRPGEVCLIQYSTTSVFKREIKKFVVDYEVTEEFGRRYGVWWGKLTAEAPVPEPRPVIFK
jgi:hypothetical protein